MDKIYEAGELMDEDNEQKKRVSAKNGLESFCFNMKRKCEDVIKWLDDNQEADVDELQLKQKEMEAACKPILTKLYESAAVGSGGGMPDIGGMPGAAGTSSGRSDEENNTTKRKATSESESSKKKSKSI